MIFPVHVRTVGMRNPSPHLMRVPFARWLLLFKDGAFSIVAMKESV